MRKRHAFASGAVGAASLTLLHETARRLIPHAPRVDVLGMRALARSMRRIDQNPPSRDQLYWLALVGDLVSNSLYYSLVGIGDKRYIWHRGVALGAAAGLGTVMLPRIVRLGGQPDRQTPVTQILTLTWYLIGGLMAAATAHILATSSRE